MRVKITNLFQTQVPYNKNYFGVFYYLEQKVTAICNQKLLWTSKKSK